MNAVRRALCGLPGFILLVACSSKTSTSPSGILLFREAAEQTGLKFQHFTGGTGEYYMPEIMGAGVGLLDYDGDGDLDVFVVQDTMIDPGKKMAEAEFPAPPNWKPGFRLFRNELIPSGKLRFTDVTDQAGVGHAGYAMGVAVGDYNNDGHPDIFVTGFDRNILYRNNGNGTFTDETQEAGLIDSRWSSSAAFVDYDKDGYLDLYVAHYLDFNIHANKDCYDSVGHRDYCRPGAYRPLPDKLYRNRGNGTFEDVSEKAGIGAVVAPGLGVVCADFNRDGWPDIYVANDGAANILWLNNKDGTFRDAALMSGAAYSADGLARAGMGVTAEDFDDSGNDSIFVTNLTGEGATLFRNIGSGSFDANGELGLLGATLPFTGFGTSWFDYDNDGLLDLFVTNGAVNIMESLRGTAYPFHQRNQLFQNQGGSFREVTNEAGPAFAISDVGRGAAFGDIDNDGDVDIVVSNNNGPVRLFLNEVGSKQHWIELRLLASGKNGDAIGARVAVFRKNQKTIWRHVHTDGSYLSASDVRVHVGLGQSPVVDAVLVVWPDGRHEKWRNVKTNQLLTLHEGTGLSQ